MDGYVKERSGSVHNYQVLGSISLRMSCLQQDEVWSYDSALSWQAGDTEGEGGQTHGASQTPGAHNYTHNSSLWPHTLHYRLIWSSKGDGNAEEALHYTAPDVEQGKANGTDYTEHAANC